MSNIILVVVLIIVPVATWVMMCVTPDYDSLPKSDTEEDDPWPDGPS